VCVCVCVCVFQYFIYHSLRTGQKQQKQKSTRETGKQVSSSTVELLSCSEQRNGGVERRRWSPGDRQISGRSEDLKSQEIFDTSVN